MERLAVVVVGSKCVDLLLDPFEPVEVHPVPYVEILCEIWSE